MASACWLRSLCVFLFAISTFVAWGVSPSLAQSASSSGYDESIRALQYYRYKRVAESGPERGRELYYFKCWQCHNEFQKTAPQLTGLYENGRQVAGELVSDAVLTNKIKNVGVGMLAFRQELRDADIPDIVSFQRVKC